MQVQIEVDVNEDEFGTIDKTDYWGRNKPIERRVMNEILSTAIPDILEKSKYIKYARVLKINGN